MRSRTKTPVSWDQASAIAATHLGGATLVELTECTQGWFNAVHRMTLEDGRTVVLKVAPPADVPVLRYEHDIITTEVDALRLVADRTDIPVPDVLVWDTTCELLPSAYFVMTECAGTLLDGLRPSLPPGTSEQIDAQILQTVADINTIAGPAFGRPTPTAPRHERWSTAFTQLVDDLLADADDADVELPASHDEIRDLLSARREALDEVTTPRLVHWDLWDPNVFVDPDTFDVVGIIDFERVLWADPLMEAQFTGRRADDDSTAAYGTPMFDSPGAIGRRRLYDLYLYLVMAIECAYRNYDTDDIEQLARPMLALTLDELRTT